MNFHASHLVSNIWYSMTIVFMAMYSAWAVSDDHTINIDSAEFSERLAEGVYYYEDKEGTLTLEQVQNIAKEDRFEKFQSNTLHFGYTNNVIWLKLSLQNSLADTLHKEKGLPIFISIHYPFLDDIQVYHQRQHSTHIQSLGDLRQFNERYFSVPRFVFPLSLYKGEQSNLFIRLESTSTLSIPLFLETEQAFINEQHHLDTLNGIYFGITFGLCIYNLFLWVGIRKRVYGLYVFAIINLMLFNATMTGYSYRLWPESIGFQQVSIYIFSVSSAAAVAFFGMAFLRTRKFQPRLHKVILSVAIFCLACIPVMLFISPVIASKLNVVAVLIGVIVLFIASVRGTLQGYRPAVYYLIGQGAVLFSVFFTILTSRGIIPLHYLAPDVMKWSSAFELIFFSIGLADLVNHERRLRTEAQRESAKNQQALLEAQIKQNEQLDQQVRQRTDELEQANQQLKDLNTKDELTGLRNRRYLNEMLTLEYQRAYREKTAISILMFDIDFFKKLNDTYGHQFGDLCLTTAGNIIQSSLHRQTDIAVRYGGEEFVVVLPNTNIEGGVLVAENIRAKFEKTAISDKQHSVNMTISIGVVGEIPKTRDDSEGMLKRADDLLYQAKDQGRNRVVS